MPEGVSKSYVVWRLDTGSGGEVTVFSRFDKNTQGEVEWADSDPRDQSDLIYLLMSSGIGRKMVGPERFR